MVICFGGLQIAAIQLLMTISGAGAAAVKQIVDAGIVQLLQPLVAMAGGQVGSAARQLWGHLAVSSGPEVGHAVAPAWRSLREAI